MGGTVQETYHVLEERGGSSRRMQIGLIYCSRILLVKSQSMFTRDLVAYMNQVGAHSFL